MNRSAYSFVPATEDPCTNLGHYLSSAKQLPCSEGLIDQWDDSVWDLKGLAKPLRASTPPRVVFGPTKRGNPGLQGELAAFARAYVAYKIAQTLGSPKQICKYTAPVSRLRDLQEEMVQSGIITIQAISPETFDATCNRLQQRSKSENGLAQLNQSLKWVFDEMSKAKLFGSAFEWRPALMPTSRGTTSRRSRINPEKPGRALTENELSALARAFHEASTPRQQIASSVFALLCCVPARIEELFSLPVECDILLDPGDGYKAGLRWWPKKGGLPQIKWVPEAMVPVAKKALERIKRHTAPARELASRAMKGEVEVPLPDDWPVFCPKVGINYDQALMVGLKDLLTTRETSTTVLQRITYQHIARYVSKSSYKSKTIFDELGISLPDGSPVEITSHMTRHYLNTVATRTSIPPADIARWSGRKNLSQNRSYDHETAQELLKRTRNSLFPKTQRKIPIDEQDSWNIAVIKETAHTTPFGWCIQSLVQSPCQLHGQCLNCQNLVCIKGAEEKLVNIKRELTRTRALQEKAEIFAKSDPRLDARWTAHFDTKVQRLEQLVSVLESDETVDGSPVCSNGRLGMPPLLQEETEPLPVSDEDS